MELSSMDVERKAFDTTRKGGFDRDQVTEYLRRVARVLAKAESDLSVSQRHSHELERQLVRARHKAEEGSKSFLFAADMKQRLISEAEVRALEILEEAHIALGAEDTAAAAAADLDVVRHRADMSEDSEAPAPVVETDVSGVDAVAAAQAEAEEMLAAARTEANRITSAADDYAVEIAADADRALAAARAAVPDVDAGEAGSLRMEAERLIAEAKDEADRLGQDAANARREAEEAAAEEAERVVAAAKTEADRLKAEADQSAKDAEAQAAAAAVESERVLSEAAELAEASLGDAREMKELAEAASLAADEDREAARIARERADQLAQAAENREREADRAFAKAEAKIQAAEAQSREMMLAAAAEGEAARKAAADHARQTEKTALDKSDRVLAAARREAASILADAREEADRILAQVRSRQETATAQLRGLGSDFEAIRARTLDVAAGEADEEDVVILLDEARERVGGVGSEIWLKGENSAAAEHPASQESRYSRRSAGLPRLGDEATSSVLSDMGTLRKTDPEGKSRKRRSK
jgi:DivIVA domain-containing protein